MLSVYFVTLPDTCYTLCYGTLLCIPCIVLFHIFFVHTPCLYTHNTITRLFMFHTDTVRLLLWYPQSYHLYTLLHFLISVTFHVVKHSCICILCIAYILLYVYVVAFITVHTTVVWLCCILHICMFISITSSLYNSMYYIQLDITVDVTR